VRAHSEAAMNLGSISMSFVTSLPVGAVVSRVMPNTDANVGKAGEIVHLAQYVRLY
jgi:hypothetical protein